MTRRHIHNFLFLLFLIRSLLAYLSSVSPHHLHHHFFLIKFGCVGGIDIASDAFHLLLETPLGGRVDHLRFDCRSLGAPRQEHYFTPTNKVTI